MLRKIDEKWTQGDYLLFEDKGYVSPGSVTRKFAVISRHSKALLGYVKWYIQWRQYTFAPLNAIFDKKCLREVAEFLEMKTAEHRERRKA